ncbi:MAG: hypothetical protein QM770_24890 [Tepidisphaeraceae bacterium]
MSSSNFPLHASSTGPANKRSLGVPLGVCVFTKPLLNRAQPANYPDYVFEILGHAGVCHEAVDEKSLVSALDHLKLLVTVGDPELDEPTRTKLVAWVNAGGAWLSIGGICGSADTLGVEYQSPVYANWGVGAVLHGEGYLTPKDGAHPAVAHVARPLHFFGGLALRSKGATVVAGSTDHHQRGPATDVLFEHVSGKGRTMTLSVDVTGTIVRIQQGMAVTRDGVPAPDGTGPTADAVLKSGDGGVLDWIFDRRPVKDVPNLNLYLDPIADLWREVILRSIFHLATKQGVALPVLWLYPRGLPAIAHMSHDSDGNEPPCAHELLGLLKQGEINSTWCIILPGYDKTLMNDIRRAGHEFATHYDAMSGPQGIPDSDDRVWGEEAFDGQHRRLKETFGKTPVTNKNHYLRWEGDIEFFDWCAKRGIEIDQSKGPSKTGEAGFNFGSCHVSVPVAFDGRYIDVLELPTLTQDLVIFAPPAIVHGLIEGTKRVHGVLHLLFHPAHVGKPGVNEAILMSIAEAKKAGMEWWTSEQINTWERARCAIRWSNHTGSSVTLHVEKDLPDATVLWLKPGTPGKAMNAWGFTFHAETRTLKGGIEHVLK